jgi:hypothetical protein
LETTVTQPTDYERRLRTEISAIRRVVAALDKLDHGTQRRIVHYLAERYDRPEVPQRKDET